MSEAASVIRWSRVNLVMIREAGREEARVGAAETEADESASGTIPNIASV